jgi:hypothetical protein
MYVPPEVLFETRRFADFHAIIEANAELLRQAQALGWKVPLVGFASVAFRALISKGRGL